MRNKKWNLTNKYNIIFLFIYIYMFKSKAGSGGNAARVAGELPSDCQDSTECHEAATCAKDKDTHLPLALLAEIYKGITQACSTSPDKAVSKDKMIAMLEIQKSRQVTSDSTFPGGYITKHGKKAQEKWEKSCDNVIQILKSDKIPANIVEQRIMMEWTASTSGMKEKAAKSIYNDLTKCMNASLASVGAGGGRRKSKRRKSKRRKSKKKKSKKKKTRTRRRRR
jgi:hypothetical protein